MDELIEKAKQSKHTAAILLIAERKDEIKQIVSKTIADYPDAFKKAIAVLAEMFFQKIINLLLDDKIDEESTDSDPQL